MLYGAAEHQVKHAAFQHIEKESLCSSSHPCALILHIDSKRHRLDMHQKLKQKQGRVGEGHDLMGVRTYLWAHTSAQSQPWAEPSGSGGEGHVTGLLHQSGCIGCGGQLPRTGHSQATWTARRAQGKRPRWDGWRSGAAAEGHLAEPVLRRAE